MSSEGTGPGVAAVTVRFPGSEFPPLTLGAGSELSAELTVENSPMLFGCRTGICGTCLCEAEGDVPPAGADEAEVLALLAAGRPRARLACQIRLVADVALRRIEAAG